MDSLKAGWKKRRGVIAALLLLILALLLARLWIRDAYVAVFAIGVLVGVGELVSRYRDAPEHAIRTTPALLYIALNAVAAVAALALVEAFEVIKGKDDAAGITRVLLAGFGAMAFFRTSIFTIRVGDQDVSIGPVAFLQIVLHAADRAVDRVRADARASAVVSCMSGVSFQAAQAALPAFCMALMQNVPADEQQEVGDAVKILQSSAMDDQIKAKNLGLLLMNIVGERVLLTAVANLAPQIKTALSVAVSPRNVNVAAGSSVPLEAICRDSTGAEIPGKIVTWSSAHAPIATVAPDGRVRGVAAGTTTVSAAVDGASDAVTVTVPAT